MLRAILVLINLFVACFFSDRLNQENHPPEVRLMTPMSGSAFQWNNPVKYAISVSDKEDGESKFDEINPNEVLLEVAFVRDTASGKKSVNDRAALYAMLGSNCMNCHTFSEKLIGPSFVDISGRYAGRIDPQTLIKHVSEGSKGVWGDVAMPGHPELNKEQIGNMVKWILNYTSAVDVSYFRGTEGFFRLQRPSTYGPSSAFSVTAGYTDHNHALREQRIFITGK
jgi:cytochrome c